MTIFAVQAEVSLSHKPAWLDSFNARYGKQASFHITLKQPCRIEKSQIPDIQEKVAAVIGNTHHQHSDISLQFKRFFIDEADGSIMAASTRNPRLLTLQQELVSILSAYKNYLEIPSEEWERNFQPHITIARDLTPELLTLAATELRHTDMPVGSVKEVTLLVVEKSMSDTPNKPRSTSRFIL